MPRFGASLEAAITRTFVGTTVSEMTAANEGTGRLLISAGSSTRTGRAFAGLAVIEKRTTGRARRGAHGG